MTLLLEKLYIYNDFFFFVLLTTKTGGDASHAFDSQGFESESESRVASPRGTAAPHTAFTMPHPPCGNTVACQAARARLLSGRHSSLTEAPAAAAGQVFIVVVFMLVGLEFVSKKCFFCCS